MAKVMVMDIVIGSKLNAEKHGDDVMDMMAMVVHIVVGLNSVMHVIDVMAMVMDIVIGLKL